MNACRGVLAFAATAAAVAMGYPPGATAADVSGYVQSTLATHGGTRSGEAEWFNGFRIALNQDLGVLRQELAYQFDIDVTGPRQDGSTDWIDLQGTLSRGEHVQVRHRIDRLQFMWSPGEFVDLNVGRQAISWGTTIYLTPADPFVPFSPSDTFRQYRRGIDALRVRAYPDSLSEMDLVVRPSQLGGREELTVLGRMLTTWKDWEISAWGGSLYGDAAVAFGSAGEIADWAVRFEAVFRDWEGRTVGRGAFGIFRIFQIADRDLGLVLEYQRDGFGAASPQDHENLLTSDPYRRGEMQTVERDQVLVRLDYQVHPLWEITGQVLWNANSGSAVIAPGFTFSASDDVVLTGNIFAAIGEQMPEKARAAETGSRAGRARAFLSLTWHF